MTVQISDAIEAPARVVRERRITEELKGMKVGQSAYPLDLKMKWAFVNYARYNGWEISIQKDGGADVWRVWRLAEKVAVQGTSEAASAKA